MKANIQLVEDHRDEINYLIESSPQYHEITDLDTLKRGAECLTRIREVLRKIDDRRKQMGRGARETIAEINNAAKEATAHLVDEERAVTSAVHAYLSEWDMEAVKGSMGSSVYLSGQPRLVVVNESRVPRALMSVDMAKVKAYREAKGKLPPGISEQVTKSVYTRPKEEVA